MLGIDFIRKLKPCKYRYIGLLDDGLEHFGFIAEEVDELVPRHAYGAVTTKSDGTLALVMTEFIAPLVKAVQELDDRIKELENFKPGREDSID